MLNIWLVLILPTHFFSKMWISWASFSAVNGHYFKTRIFHLGLCSFLSLYFLSFWCVLLLLFGVFKVFFFLVCFEAFFCFFFLFWLWYIFLYTHIFICKANLHREDQKQCCENHVSVNSWCKSLLMLQKGMENSTGRNRTLQMAASWFHVPRKAFIQN